MTLLFYMTIYADVLVLKNGNELKGIVKGMMEDKVRFHTFGGILVIPEERIKEIKEENSPVNAMILAELLLFEGNLVQAINAYSTALDQGISIQQMQASIVQNEGKFFSRLRFLDDKGKETLIEFFEHLLTGKDQSYDFIFLSAQLFFHIERSDKVFPLLVMLPAQYYESGPKKKDFAVSYFRQLIRDLLKKEEFKEVIAYIEKINNIAPELGRSSELLLYLNWAAKKREENNFKEALAIYSEKILPGYPEIASNRISFTLNSLAQWATENEKFDYAISIIKPFWEKYRNPQIRYLMLNLYQSLGEHLIQQGEISEACDIFNRYYDLKGDGEEKTFLYLCQYYEQRQQIKEADAYAHYKLGQFCLKHKLFELAEAEFEQAKNDPQIKKNVELQLKLLGEKQQVEMLEKAMGLYKQERYLPAMDVGHALLQKFPQSNLRKEMEELISLAQRSLADAQQKRPYLAEVYYQQAERYYFLRNYKEAAQKLNLILTNYSDTPAAEKARRLARQLITMAKIRQLEQAGQTDEPLPDIAITDVEEVPHKNELAKEIRALLEVIIP